MFIDIKKVFPDGVIPALPASDISRLTAKFVSQEVVDTALAQLAAERPDLVLALIERDINSDGDIEESSHEIYDYFRNASFKVSGADMTPAVSSRLIFELRGRVRLLLGLSLEGGSSKEQEGAS